MDLRVFVNSACKEFRDYFLHHYWFCPSCSMGASAELEHFLQEGESSSCLRGSTRIHMSGKSETWKIQIHIYLPSSIKRSEQLPSQETLVSQPAERRNSWTVGLPASHEESPRTTASTSAVLGWVSHWCSCVLICYMKTQSKVMSAKTISSHEEALCLSLW